MALGASRLYNPKENLLLIRGRLHAGSIRCNLRLQTAADAAAFEPDAVNSPAARCAGLSGEAKLRNVAGLPRVTENTENKRDDEDRSGHQYRRFAPHGETA